jgi:hypothetical protein
MTSLGINKKVVENVDSIGQCTVCQAVLIGSLLSGSESEKEKKLPAEDALSSCIADENLTSGITS